MGTILIIILVLVVIGALPPKVRDKSKDNVRQTFQKLLPAGAE